MTEPVAEQIMAKVRTRVATAFDAFRSSRVATWQPKDQATHVFQGNLTPNPEISCPGNPPAQGWTLQAAVAGVVKPSDRDTTPVDTYKNRMGADILAAITNATTWHNWDGLAVNTEMGEIEDFTAADGSASGVIVRLNIYFRTDEDDMYTARA